VAPPRQQYGMQMLNQHYGMGSIAVPDACCQPDPFLITELREMHGLHFRHAIHCQ